MSEQEGVRVQAGAAEAGAGVPDEAPPGMPDFAVEVADGDPEYGLRFVSDYEPGGSYPAVPPMPAEEQHRQGLQPQAAADEKAAGNEDGA